jgi:hypothetical protein
MSYQSVDLDSPRQFTCCNVQNLHLYTNYIYFLTAIELLIAMEVQALILAY